MRPPGRPASLSVTFAPAGERLRLRGSADCGVPHPRHMAPSSPAQAPGSMTVPPLFGWESILVVLLVVAVVAVAFVAFGAVRAGRSDRSEWQAWLDTRSASHGQPVDLDEPAT